MRRTTSLTAAALIGLTVPGLALLGAGAASGAAETCQGRTATIVGAGHRVDGTEGPDVILTNGARAVHAKGGDDLVCITGPYTGRYLAVDVRAGDGKDVVDGTGSPRQEVHAQMGSGVDTFLGGGAGDSVVLDYPTPQGASTPSTAAAVSTSSASPPAPVTSSSTMRPAASPRAERSARRGQGSKGSGSSSPLAPSG
ncbi:hypothetical protein GCM10011376_08430 [Nocardioides flavus (ex Wang et al. 2016)]|uniref:Uncharacterized protein n=1 Tax=Nocardioides flavus (ex Wang et al. 2016) TaxID=2058780 RepID=A0ABQ3HH82_9ACTN|nr:hypothetical protein [Nocardioides flavus (ex Wang et al. 2016)]GHE16233.1 hypothetical protein GCM10011376_08430 [Nocardioides flavus (ex Wang et al. 2016)]